MSDLASHVLLLASRPNQRTTPLDTLAFLRQEISNGKSVVLSGVIEDYGFTMPRDVAEHVAKAYIITRPHPGDQDMVINVVHQLLCSVLKDREALKLVDVDDLGFRPEERLLELPDSAIYERSYTSGACLARLGALAASIEPGITAVGVHDLGIHGALPQGIGVLLVRSLRAAKTCEDMGLDFDVLPSFGFPHSSTDFDAYAHLWESRLGIEKIAELKEDREVKAALNLGLRLGRLHEEGVLPDVHKDNFIPHEMFLVDHDGWRLTLGPPVTDMCATNLAILLAELETWEWELFKAGYQSSRGLAGHRVTSYIETGDERAWTWLMRHGLYVDALAELHEVLAGPEELDEEERAILLSEAAFSHTRMGRHADSARLLREAIALFDQETDQVVLRFNLAKSLARMGEKEAAYKQFKTVIKKAPKTSEYRQLVTDARRFLLDLRFR